MARRADVVVIGGGVIGLCVARALGQRGRHVTVLDKEELGEGCSTGNAGLLVPSHVVPLAAPGVVGQGLRWLFQRGSPFRIKPRWDLRLFRWLWTFYRSCNAEHVRRAAPVLRDLSLASRSRYEDWAGGDFDFGFRSSGLLIAYETTKGREHERKHVEWAREVGIEASLLDRTGVDEVTPHLPASVKGGVYYHGDALLEPTRLIQVLARQIEQQGADLRQGVAVTGFECQDNTVRLVQTTEGSIAPEDVVLAAGAWSGPLGRELGLRVPVEPGKGYSVTLEGPSDAPDVPFILTEKKISVTPLGGRMRFGGTLELAGFDASIDGRRLRPILKTAAEYVPSINVESPDAVDAWVGFRPCTPDGLPIIGPVPGYDNLVLATGHSMMGVSLAPITGQLVAETVQGETPTFDVAPVRLSRFY